MGLNEEDTPSADVRCILCNLADENETTGPLSSKGGISAHQNCLIFSSGIYCKSSPSFDDLFGFDVNDVRKEYIRGRKLRCHRCGKKGATAGCEMSRCKRSYHYPCAIEDHARAVEKVSKGFFTLYCVKHDPKRPRNPERLQANESSRSSPGSNDSKRPRLDSSHAGTSSESDSSTYIRFQSRKRKSEVVISDSDEPIDIDPTLGPIELDPEDIIPPKQHGSTPVPEDERDKEEPRADISGVPFPSVDDDETDVEEVSACGPCHTMCHPAVPPSTTRWNLVLLKGAKSPSLLRTEYRHENVSFNVIVDSGPSIESENSISPCSPSFAPGGGGGAAAAAAAAATPVCNSNGPLSAPENAAPVHAATTTAIIHPPPDGCPSLDSPPLGVVAAAESAGSPNRSSPTAPSCEDPDEQTAHPACQDPPDISHDPPECKATPTDRPLDLTAPPGGSTMSPQHNEGTEEARVSETGAAVFWRRCNEVGCTEAIFTEVTHQITSLAEKVQGQHATHQDYAVALRILEASGKLPAIFKQLEQDFEERERELQRKREALRDARAMLNHLS
ncbi:uncharacterized protein phf11 isoform X2 [Colossoma macropomum]|uniref:uncharacterized protein phf11 isoform X2 n=1 Tax=Colossoma macropomum TaxID=42526 RepID=UPI0018650185|nr:uncharacterized protein phf11 isoform X2 [Colossoma macropomum]